MFIYKYVRKQKMIKKNSISCSKWDIYMDSALLFKRKGVFLY